MVSLIRISRGKKNGSWVDLITVYWSYCNKHSAYLIPGLGFLSFEEGNVHSVNKDLNQREG